MVHFWDNFIYPGCANVKLSAFSLGFFWLKKNTNFEKHLEHLEVYFCGVKEENQFFWLVLSFFIFTRTWGNDPI